MWFSIQKRTFGKLYRYYLKKLRWVLLTLVANFIAALLLYWTTKKSINLEDYATPALIFSSFCYFALSQNFSYLGLIILLVYIPILLSIRKGSKTSPRFSEESHILLFGCPNTRQTILAAKLAAFMTYYCGINLVGIVLPTLLVYALNTPLSGLALLVFFLLAGLLLNLVNFLLFGPALLYAYTARSLVGIFSVLFYAVVSGVLSWAVYKYLPFFSPLLFLVAVLAAGFFIYQGWKIFANQDLG